VVTAGAPAWVSVSVASGWRSPQAARAVDAPALANPVRTRAWLAGMTAADKVGLIDRLDTQALLGEEVLVLQLQGGWAQVAVMDQATPLDTRGYPAWMPVRQLTATAPPRSNQSVTVIAPTAFLTNASSSLEVSFGTTLPVLGQDSTAYQVGLPGGAVMTVAASIIATARSFVGLPYLWGGTSGFGFDCSGLVHQVYKAHGVLLPRDADPQSKVGVAVSRSNLEPGDLVFFSSGGVAYHVVIYAGGGLVIESPSPGYPVDEVPLASMAVIGDYSGARRVIGLPQPVPTR
jgi:gamma-D-glutamyl-L-lysine dipeptidyl-peptidase